MRRARSRLAVAALIAAGLATAIRLVSGTRSHRMTASHRRPTGTTARSTGRVVTPRAVGVFDNGPPPVRRVFAGSESVFYSIDFMGDMPLPGGYAGVADTLGTAQADRMWPD
jgi:hypothetical protein